MHTALIKKEQESPSQVIARTTSSWQNKCRFDNRTNGETKARHGNPETGLYWGAAGKCDDHSEIKTG
jgi:hypothetical protein